MGKGVGSQYLRNFCILPRGSHILSSGMDDCLLDVLVWCDLASLGCSGVSLSPTSGDRTVTVCPDCMVNWANQFLTAW